MSGQFDAIKAMYQDSFRKNGDSPAALLTPKGRHALRFRSVLPYLHGKGTTSILDYGCGLGYLYDYLNQKSANIDYRGLDITPEFIDTCVEKFSPKAKFSLIQPEDKIDGQYDIVFSSGVFNIRLNGGEADSKAYAFDRIESLFQSCGDVLICDFLSPFVDFKQEESLHFSIDEIAEFCYKRLSRRFLIRHDFLPYEFTLIVHKNANIERPGNFYTADGIFLSDEEVK